MKKLLLLPVLILISTPAIQAQKIVVSIPPQSEIARALSGPDAEIRVLIQAGRSPENYSPGPRSLAEIISSDVLIPMGLPFERSLLKKIRKLAPGLQICEDAIPSSAPGHLDPHVWLDPDGAMSHAAAMAACLEKLEGSNGDKLKDRLREYARRLEQTRSRAAGLLKPFKNRTILVYHPAYGHFLRRFQLRQLSIEQDGKAPSARSMARIIEESRSLGIHTIFVQPSMKSNAVGAVAEALDARIVELDPLAPDLTANIERIAAAIALSFPHDQKVSAR